MEKEQRTTPHILADATMEEIIYNAAHVQPTERQVRHQELEFYSLIHFGLIPLPIRNGGAEKRIQPFFILRNWMPNDG
ncbi:hypothetical protein [Lederbergia sp. NSJ-179]|uniref:hypothetical protein n=1 Tax=Lederbergia sp. NSJ-179 TaxID=2931402 RepID=UPI0037BEDE5C